MRVWILGVLGCAGMLLAYSPSARACSCAPPSSGVGIAPASGEIVPTDTLIWIDWDALGEGLGVELLDVEADSVIALNSLDGDNEYWGALRMFRPERELSPNTNYALLNAGDSEVEDPIPLSVFATGNGPTQTPPSTPNVSKTSAMSGIDALPLTGLIFGENSCTTTEGTWVLTVEYFSSGRMDVVTLDPDAGTPEHANDPMIAERTTTGAFRLGKGTCLWNNNEAGPLRREDVRVGTFDIAGNFSGWSEVTPASYPIAGCSCDATSHRQGGSPLGPGILAVFILGLTTRKTASRRRANG